ncbi:hypothetical protein V6N11_063427, partial [Hibiscus sabdariffa]
MESSSTSFSLSKRRKTVDSKESQELELTSTDIKLGNALRFLSNSRNKPITVATSSKSGGVLVGGEMCSSLSSGDDSSASNESCDFVKYSLRFVDLKVKSFETEISTCMVNKFSVETAPTIELTGDSEETASPHRRKPPSEAEIDEFFTVAEKSLAFVVLNELLEVDSDEKEKAKCNKRKRAPYDGLYENAELKSAVMERALQIQANLSPEFPSLVKYMLPSHVTGGFWLGLPKHFCSNHLPKEDRIMVLEDEEGEEFEAKYLVVKVGLSGGWRGFSIAHKLLEGNEDNICENRISVGKTENGNNHVPRSSNLGPTADQSENGRMDLSSEVSDGVRLSESIVNFKDVKSFEDFNIVANGLNLDSEISKYLQKKYYELCCNQK